MTASAPRAAGVVVLGTGAADGIPQPFCACATCTDARNRGEQRAPGGVLVDGEILLDAAPGVGIAAARAGVSLADVHTATTGSRPCCCIGSGNSGRSHCGSSDRHR